MIYKIFIGFLTAFILFTNQIAMAADTATAPANEKLRLDLLYVQVAPTGKITQICNQNHQCQYKLILNNVSPFLLTFNSGKPPVGGSILNKTFIRQYYFKSGVSSELNSALLTFENNQLHQYLIIITNPVYLPKKQEMIYQIRFMKTSPTIPNNTQLKNVALFIDNVCAICVGH